MPDFETWRGADEARSRAAEAWARIQDQLTMVIIRRGGMTLDAQTVRIEFGDEAREDVSLHEWLNVVPGVQHAVVFGVRDHARVADTDIKRGDRFVVGVTEFEVIGVVTGIGEVQAICEART